MAGNNASGLGKLADLHEALGDRASGRTFTVSWPRLGDRLRVDGDGGVGLEEFEEELGILVRC